MYGSVNEAFMKITIGWTVDILDVVGLCSTCPYGQATTAEA